MLVLVVYVHFFEDAKKVASHYFIDEIDAVGRQRGVAWVAVMMNANKLFNQLLIEMDGRRKRRNYCYWQQNKP